MIVHMHTASGIAVHKYGQDGICTYLSDPYVYEDRPLEWQRRGLQQTAAGYGKTLASSRYVRLTDGRARRVYVTCYSNAGTAWIILDGLCVVVT